MFIDPFRTFDEARYSHHLIHFTWAALLLLTKAKVQKIACDQLSVNMAARQMFGTCDLVWPVTKVVTRATCPHVSMITPTGVYKKQERKQIAKLNIISDI